MASNRSESETRLIPNSSVRGIQSKTNQFERNKHEINYKIIMYFVIGFLSCASNIILCLVYGRNRYLLRKAYNIILLTLGIIDLLTGKIQNILETRGNW